MRRIAVICAALLIAGLAACSQEKKITIAVAGPMTGSDAAFGEQFRKGAEKAVADINAAGGLLGEQIQLEVGDDGCEGKQAVSVANDLVAKGVVFVAGHFCSGASIPASSVYAESGIVQISPGSTNPDYTERGLATAFRVCGRDDAQGPTAAAYVAAHFAGKKVAIVDDQSQYGKGLADQFRTALNGAGMKEAMDESITRGDKDFGPLVSRLKQGGIDVVYFGGYQTEGGLIVRQMREQNVAAVLIGGDALVTEQFWSITGPAGEGTLMTFGPDPRLNPDNADLVKYFRDNGYEPEAYTLYTYAAVQAWADAVKAAGTTDGAKVAAALKAGKFKTALGEIGFDAKGDVTAPGYVFYVWKDGKYVYAE